jgi:hypothetical protein
LVAVLVIAVTVSLSSSLMGLSTPATKDL